MTDQNEEKKFEDNLVEGTDDLEFVEAPEGDEEVGMDVIDTLVAERDEWRDRALRAAAEAENTKRRAETQVNDARAAEDLERVRVLFDDLEQKEQLIGLLDDVGVAQGVRIYIGAETRLFSLSGSAVIAAPYMSGRQRVLGAIGVIGPARLNYARVIPLVDYTARVLGRILDGQET